MASKSSPNGTCIQNAINSPIADSRNSETILEQNNKQRPMTLDLNIMDSVTVNNQSKRKVDQNECYHSSMNISESQQNESNGHEHRSKYKAKVPLTPDEYCWRFSYACMLFRFLTDGVEYAIILPTLWPYLKSSMNADVSYVGIVLGAYAVGGLVSAPVAGYLSDNLSHIYSNKLLLSVGCFLSMTGNFLYFLAPNKEYVTIGRFIAGFGVDPIILAEIGRVPFLTSQQRSQHISGVYMFRQVGLLLGPCFVIALSGIKPRTCFNGKLTFDQYNSAGLVTSMIYLGSALAFICLYDTKFENTSSSEESKSLDPSRQNDNNTELTSVTNISDEKSVVVNCNRNDTSITETPLELQSDAFILKKNPLPNKHQRPEKKSNLESLENPKTKIADFKRIFTYEPIIISLFGAYSSYYMQSSIEAVLMPLSEYLFNFNQVHVSKLFICIGIEAFISYMATGLSCTNKLTGGIRGKALIGGLGNEIIAVGFLIFAHFATPSGIFWTFPYFIISVIIYIWCMPFMLVGSASLLSSSTPIEYQGLMQSLRTSAQNIALILGPLFTTQIYARYGHTAIWVMPVVHASIFLAFVIVSWDNLSVEKLEYLAKGRGAKRKAGIDEKSVF